MFRYHPQSAPTPHGAGCASGEIVRCARDPERRGARAAQIVLRYDVVGISFISTKKTSMRKIPGTRASTSLDLLFVKHDYYTTTTIYTI